MRGKLNMNIRVFVLNVAIYIKFSFYRKENNFDTSRSSFPYHMRADIASKNPVFYYTYYNIV